MSEEAIKKLIETLPASGTAVSNKRVQEKLGWSREEYERVRDLALAEGAIRKGPGQGGSIRRNVPTEEESAPPAAAAPEPRAEADEEGDAPIAGVVPTNPKEEFALQLHADVEERRAGGRRTYEQALAELVIGGLDDGTFEEPVAYTYVDVDSFTGELRLRFDGYDLHEDDDDDRTIIDLFVVHGASPVVLDGDRARVAIPVFEGAPVNALLRAARRFVEESRKGLHTELTDDHEARDVARSIKASKALARVCVNLITNAEVKQFDRSAETVDGVEIVKRVMDVNYLRRLSTPDAIEVDFTAAQTGGIPCVALPNANPTYRSYLAIVPGAFLCKLYERYQQRLLEANVRSFMRAGNNSVNHGIYKTISGAPEMFFAYNNGITAIAEELVVEPSADGGVALVRCRNLQIVNGGQTTASLYYASLRKGVSLDRVFVPMKLNEVLDRSRASEVVQSISKWANSQNKVNLSDFGANQPFHVELQKVAARETPPAPAPKAPKGSHWYYERMRGQYQNDLNLERTKAKRQAYMARYPKSQVLTKTDVARYFMIWAQKPHLVSYGSEKNYQSFRKHMAEDFVPDARWFHELVAKALLTERCDEIVSKSNVPGYKANIVAYAVALLSKTRGDKVDLERIWSIQRVDDETAAWLTQAIDPVRAHLTKPAAEGRNVGEWCKREECWKTLVASFASQAK